MGGNRWARRGLGRILSSSNQISGSDFEERWSETAQLYRICLYHEGEEREISESAEMKKQSFSHEEVEAEEVRGGKMSIFEVIRYRVRYLTEGGVFGSEAFVDEVFHRNREKFGKKRESGAREMREANWEGFAVLRDLQGKILESTRAVLR